MPAAPIPAPADQKRWIQLGLGLVAMMAISSPQYVWTLFVKPFQATTGASLAAVQITFSLLIVLQTFFSPVQGYLLDRFGPKLLIALGMVLTGLGWVSAAYVDTLIGLYATYGLLCGVGTGIVYVGIVGLMVRWFPDRRGFAAGLVAAGYGMGAMLTTIPIDLIMGASGYRTALVVFGIVFGAVGFLAALGLRAPRPDEVPAAARLATSAADTGPKDMLRTPLFWLMFAMMTMMSTGGPHGHVAVRRVRARIRHRGRARARPCGAAAGAYLRPSHERLHAPVLRLGVGPYRAREHDGDGVPARSRGNRPAARVSPERGRLRGPVGLVFFSWGEIFSLFPSTLTDTFGTRDATTNYGFLYMAQGVGSVLGGPVAALLRDATGSWLPVFGIVIAMDVATGLLALFVLKPMRQAWLGIPQRRAVSVGLQAG